VDDRGADLAVIMAVAGSVFDKRLPERTAVLGEVSLTGEIRPVDRMLNRVSECVRRGYTRVITPYSGSIKGIKEAEIVTVRNIRDALSLLV
jgi:DNA repair protein RadA/Sms